jgi:hypothetical protein
MNALSRAIFSLHYFTTMFSFFGGNVAGPEKVSVPGSRFRVLDPTQDPKEPTRRTRDRSDPYNIARGLLKGYRERKEHK